MNRTMQQEIEKAVRDGQSVTLSIVPQHDEPTFSIVGVLMYLKIGVWTPKEIALDVRFKDSLNIVALKEAERLIEAFVDATNKAFALKLTGIISESIHEKDENGEFLSQYKAP